jgi:hypothetical protein
MSEWLERIWSRFTETTGQYIGSILGGLVILIVGWVIATVVRAVIAAVLSKTGLDRKLAGWFGDEEAKTTADASKWLSQGAYYLILIIAVVAFLETLKLGQISLAFSETISNIIEATILLVIGLVLAQVVRAVVARILSTARVEERLAKSAGMPDDKRPALVRPLSGAAYWLVLLLFLPAILEALALQSMLLPLQDMFRKVFEFLPNVLVAGIILVIGWFIAQIVRNIVTSFLSATRVDAMSGKLGLETVLGERSISALAGLVVYVLILIPVIVSSLDALQLEAISGPAKEMLTKVMNAIPNIFAACLIVILAMVVGKFIAGLIANLMANIGLDTYFVKVGLSQEGREPGRKPSEIAGVIALIYILLFAAIEASELLGFLGLKTIFMEVTFITARILFGLVIIGLGLWVARFVAVRISQTDTPSASILATLARIGVIVLVGAIGLREMGLANEIINLAFGLLLGALAVAVAIAFGLGGRDLAAKQLESWAKSLKGEK